ncbi:MULTISPECIES: ABC transporter permease [Paenibacillus]|uniref:ABC transporter permease subunit n=1 Tax=Paenibacillus campinasensis TaxID=66347 RepID=A0A268EJV8_9BACL|nr:MULTISPECIES: ABC transporter permease [Paenibacillus]MUG67363.1 ABC transporter permease subunit [Paenibacillus campinasensis]PAD73405.1 lantibiotic ABC transporter permease [Paenibacillus campinasensis]PAK51195.1 lantibiotic ABC transporter permease [Paenibacillus sp. 7541]
MNMLLRAETMKTQWRVVILLILLDTLINALMGMEQLDSLKEFFPPSWMSLYIHSVNLHAMFFYPLYCGIIASLLCMYEHRDGGWKIALAFPGPRYHIFYAKYLVLIGILAVVQLVFMLGYLAAGKLAHAPGSIPWGTLAYTGFGGWLGILPLAALQLIVSIKVRNFGASLALAIGYVVPNIVFTGFHSTIGAWLPFTIPYYVMMPQEAIYAPRVEPYSLWAIVFFTGGLYLWLGQRFFERRDWL